MYLCVFCHMQLSIKVHGHVCHSSLFQLIQSDQFVSKLSIIMEEYQPYLHRDTIYQRTFYVVEGSLAKNIQNLQFLLVN